jgi:DNA-binding transcriptional LysR family regulator
MPVNLSRVNLNLLVALDVLLKEQNVTRAGQRLFITQSAMSSILKQLREVFHDELFVRGQSSKMIPTDFALSLQQPLCEFLSKAEAVFSTGKTFDPKTTECILRIGMSDYAEAVLLPLLVDYLTDHAPRIELDIRHMNYIDNAHVFENGELDLAIGIFDEVPANLMVQKLYSDEVVLIGKKGHPAFNAPLSLEIYAGLPQVAVVLFRDRSLHRTEQVMREAGLRRNVIANVPHVLSAFYTVAASTSQLICGLPHRLVAPFLLGDGFVSAPLPIADSGFDVKQVWHPRSEQSSASQWLREAVARLAVVNPPPAG